MEEKKKGKPTAWHQKHLSRAVPMAGCCRGGSCSSSLCCGHIPRARGAPGGRMVSARRAWSSEGVRQAAPCPPHVPPHAAAPPRSPRGDPQRGARASPSHAAVKAWTLPPRALYSQGKITAEISSEKSFLAKPNSPHLQKKKVQKKTQTHSTSCCLAQRVLVFSPRAPAPSVVLLLNEGENLTWHVNIHVAKLRGWGNVQGVLLKP